MKVDIGVSRCGVWCRGTKSGESVVVEIGGKEYVDIAVAGEASIERVGEI